MNPRPHPLGVTSHPEWDGVWSRYIDLSEGLEPEADAPIEQDREPTNAPIFIAVMAVMLIGLSLIASVS